MFTLNHALERVRRDLGDTESLNAEWSTEALERHLTHALRDLSQHIPREMKTTLQTTANSRDLSVAILTDRIRIVAVEWKTAQYPPVYRRWSLWQDTLTLLADSAPTAAEDVNVYWHANHYLNPEGSSLPTWAEDILVMGATGYAAEEAAARATNQVNQGGADVPSRYAAQAKAALQQFRSELRKRGTHGSVRTSTLYVPAANIPTQDTDPGPP